MKTAARFLRMEEQKIKDGIVKDFIYIGSDGKEHILQKVISRANEHAILEATLSIGLNHASERIEVITEDKPYNAHRRKFRSDHLNLLSKASDFYRAVCKHYEL